MNLIVTHAFGKYDVGATITDKDEIEAALAVNPHYVVRVAASDPEPAPAPQPAPVPKPAPVDPTAN